MTLEQLMLETGRQMQLLTLYLVAAVAMAATVFYTLLAIFVTGLRGKSNCMLYAYRAYRRGAFVMIRKTQWGRVWRWPHFRWSDDGTEWWEFVPFARKRRRVIPPLLFSGEVRRWVPLVLVGLLLWAQPAHAAIAFVSEKSTSSGGSGTTVSTGTQTHTAGNLLLVVLVHQSTSTTESCANTALDTFTRTPNSPVQDGLVRNISVFYTLSTNGAVNDNVTCTFGVSESYTGVGVLEFSGSSFTFGSDAKDQQTSASASPGTITVTNPAVIVIGLSSNSGVGGGGVSSWPSGFTAYGLDAGGSPPSGGFYGFAYGIVTASQNPTVTLTGSTAWRVMGAGFNEGGGAAPTVHPCGTLLLLGVGCEAQP